MNTRLRALAAALAACALSAAAPALAAAAPTVANLRVEAKGRALDPGVSYVNDSARLATAPSQCDGSGKPRTVRGPSAIGIVDYAQETNPRLSPYFVSDKFSFGLIVCRIGAYGAFSPSEAWLYKVNHVSPQVGGDQYALSRGDRVLWYFADFSGGENTGDELELRAPPRVRPNRPFTVKAISYNAEGDAKPAAGVRVTGDATGVTAPNGEATVIAGRKGTIGLRAKRGNDIPAAPVRVCSNSDLGRCPARRGQRIVGTRRADTISGTRGPDVIGGRAGDDRIDVAGGDRDRVSCGAGVDRVRADRGDLVARDCEQVVDASGAPLGGAGSSGSGSSAGGALCQQSARGDRSCNVR